MGSEDTNRSVGFGRRLHEIRTSRGIAQETLAQMAGLDRNYVTEAERGKANPTLATIGKLADALGVKDLALLSDEECQASLQSAERG